MQWDSLPLKPRTILSKKLSWCLMTTGKSVENMLSYTISQRWSCNGRIHRLVVSIAFKTCLATLLPAEVVVPDMLCILSCLCVLFCPLHCCTFPFCADVPWENSQAIMSGAEASSTSVAKTPWAFFSRLMSKVILTIGMVGTNIMVKFGTTPTLTTALSMKPGEPPP